MPSETKNEILKVSGVIGLCLLAFLLLQVGYSYLLAFLGIARTEHYNLSCVIQVVYSILVVMLPFVFGSMAIRKLQKRSPDYLRLNKPTSWRYFGMAIAISFMALILLNYLSGALTLFLSRHGITFDAAPDFGVPKNVSGYFFLLLADVLVPALAEEYVCRGVILQSLRKYGDSAAIFISALFFALMHGNMSQAPFAFFLGIFIGRMVVLTESLWTGIAIHVVNNLYAVVMLILNQTVSTVVLTAVMIILDTLIIIAGLIALIWLGAYYQELGPDKLYSPGGRLTAGRRYYRHLAELYTLISPPTLAAVVYFLVKLFGSIHTGG